VKIPSFFKRALVFQIGGKSYLKICWQKGYNFLHVWGGMRVWGIITFEQAGEQAGEQSGDVSSC
jgi:hypothetical protein